jgi:hypothetical protein
MMRSRKVLAIAVLLIGVMTSIGLAYVLHDGGVVAQASIATIPDRLIRKDTTWTLSGSPYELNSDVQIAPSVTLTIEAGVAVSGVSPGGQIYIYGGLHVPGTSSLPVTFSGVSVNDYRADQYKGSIFISHAEFSARSAFLGSEGNWQIQNSLFSAGSSGQLQLYCRDKNCDIRNSTFLSSTVILAGVNSSNNIFDAPVVAAYDGQHVGNIYVVEGAEFGGHATIKNNLFQSGLLRITMDQSSLDWPLFRYNSFLELPSDSVIVQGLSQPVSITTFINNFWGTTNTTEIDNIIFDANDTLDPHYPYIIYRPFLTAPHPDTPHYDPPTPTPTPTFTPTNTPTATSTPTETPTLTPDLIATQTAISNQIETAVAATLTDIADNMPTPTPTGTKTAIETPTNTPTGTLTPTATATPTDVNAAQTAVANQVATSVAATLTALAPQPTDGTGTPGSPQGANQLSLPSIIR